MHLITVLIEKVFIQKKYIYVGSVRRILHRLLDIKAKELEKIAPIKREKSINCILLGTLSYQPFYITCAIRFGVRI